MAGDDFRSEYKIGRPRQLYKGPPKRDVKPIDKRLEAKSRPESR